MKAKMMKLLLCICSIFTMIAMVGCEVTNTTTSIENSEVVSTTETSKADDNISTKVFPKDKIVDVKITIDEDDFQSMMDNASEEEMMTASVEYNGERIDNVGVRTKGNLSLRSVVSMEDSNRYSLKLSFDEYISSQNLYGISKINLNNGYSDPSYMREFLTYELAEQMGLPTPGYSFVNVYVNDELYGFYLAVQQIDEQYLESNFGNSYGALYKGEMTGSGSDLLWIDDNIKSYTGLVQKSDKSNDDILIDMLDELNNGTDYEKFLDVEEVLKYIALNVVTNNTDSYIGQNKQNYYLYEDDGIFSVLPWDYNMAFGGLGKSNLLIDEPTQGALAERPLVAKLLAVEEYKEMYHDIIQNVTEGYLAPSTFKERVEELAAMISPYVKEDISSFYTYEEYLSGITSLISTNETQVNNINQQLAGTIASSGDGSGSGGGMGGGRRDMPAMAGNNAQSTSTELTAPGGQAPPTDAQNAQGGQTPSTDGQNVQGGQDFPTDGQNFQGGGFPGGGMGGGERPNGMGGGGPGGMGGFGEQGAQPEGSVTEAIAAGISLLVLLLAGAFITFYKRKRL